MQTIVSRKPPCCFIRCGLRAHLPAPLGTATRRRIVEALTANAPRAFPAVKYNMKRSPLGNIYDAGGVVTISSHDEMRCLLAHVPGAAGLVALLTRRVLPPLPPKYKGPIAHGV